MLPAFSFNVGQSIQGDLVTCGKFDGKTPSLAFGVTGGKVLVHSPHEGGQGGNAITPSVRYLNFNKSITALAAGCLSTDPGKSQDLLFVGTESNLLAYDVERNADVFFRDVADGVNTMILGRVSHMPKPLIFAGGNCSIFGFDSEGTEAFWTVTCDNVSSLAFCDVNNDGIKELIVGSDDFEMRVFKNEEVINEITETDKVTHLCPLYSSKYGYAVANNTVGVYESMNKRTWRVKGKGKVTCLQSYDFDADGIPELISGWSNGTFNVRRDSNGEIIFKGNMGGGGGSTRVAGLVTADYRLDGKEELIVCAENGEVRGYLPMSQDTGDMTMTGGGMAGDGADDDRGLSDGVMSNDQKALIELQAKKQDLANELRLLEKGMKSARETKGNQLPPGTLPAGTTLSYKLEANLELESVVVRVETQAAQVVIVNLLVIDQEGLLLAGQEVCSVSPMNQTNYAILPIKTSRNMQYTLRVQTHIATRGFTSTHIHVYEADITIPKFSGFARLKDTGDSQSPYCLDYYKGDYPMSTVTFRLPESSTRVVEWLTTSFLACQGPGIRKENTSDSRIKYNFVAFNAPALVVSDGDSYGEGGKVKGPTKYPLYIEMYADDKTADSTFASASSGTQVTVRCDSMDLVGELVQDLCKFLNVTELTSRVDFPHEMEKFEDTIHKIADFNAQRMSLTADMADDSQKIKAYIVRAEDSRLMSDMSTMRKAYTELYSLNSQLLGGHNIRRTTHEGLIACLKDVNNMIQKAANLRVGKIKTSIIADCRANVKTNNLTALLKIIKTGSENPTV